MTITSREIFEGDRIPPGYGIAYKNIVSATAVCYPLPFNWIVGWGRRVWFALVQGPKQKELDAAYEKGKSHGYIHGFREGVDQGTQNALLAIKESYANLFNK